jgi:RNase P subunit RPR2
MKRNISKSKKDKSARISCQKCGASLYLMPPGARVSNRSQSTETIDAACECGHRQSIHISLDAGQPRA